MVLILIVDQIGGLGHARFRGSACYVFHFYGFFDGHFAMLYFLQEWSFLPPLVHSKSLYLLA